MPDRAGEIAPVSTTAPALESWQDDFATIYASGERSVRPTSG